MKKTRGWMFTINNELILQFASYDNIKFIIYQLECGESGTMHLQGYLELHQPRALSWLKKLHPGAHWEMRKGSRIQAVQYVTKEETREDMPWIWKEKQWDQYGKDGKMELTEWINSHFPWMKKEEKGLSRALRLAEIKSKLDGGSSSEDIADEYFEDWVRHYRAFERYLLIKSTPRNHEVKLIIVQGPTGTGKSKYCIDNWGTDAYWKQRSQWWDGYSNHRCIILDEFYGWLPFDLLLRLCDRYPLMLETKGGQVNCTASTVVITTNQLPDRWYNNVYFPALLRRVSLFIVMPELGDNRLFTNYSDAVKVMHR